MALPIYNVHPLDVTDIPRDWTTPSSVTITAVVSTVSPAGPIVAGSFTGLRSITRFSGGTTVIVYQVEELTTFSSGEKRTKEFNVSVIDN